MPGFENSIDLVPGFENSVDPDQLDHVVFHSASCEYMLINGILQVN